MEQQQQQQQLHRGVLDGIARLADPHYRQRRHTLVVDVYDKPPIDRQSLDHLCHFLDDSDSHEVRITELWLSYVQLVSDPPDGGLNALRDFFARSDTKLTKVSICGCNFGSQEDAAQLLAAFHINRTITRLSLQSIDNLQGIALGNCLCGLLQNMPQLQRLDCSCINLRVQGVRAFQPALQANRTLKQLYFSDCNLGDEGIRLIADALVGNTTMGGLNIGWNRITSNGLDDITRLLESMQLKSIKLAGNNMVFDSAASTLRFARVLSRHEFLKELDLCICGIRDEGMRIIVDGLVGNKILEVLNIGRALISFTVLADIARLIESTQLKKIDFGRNPSVFKNENANQQFVSTLRHQHTTVQELVGIPTTGGLCHTTKIICARNKNLNQVNLLLTPPPLHHRNGSSTTMMLKTCHKAIAKFAMDGLPVVILEQVPFLNFSEPDQPFWKSVSSDPLQQCYWRILLLLVHTIVLLRILFAEGVAVAQ